MDPSDALLIVTPNEDGEYDVKRSVRAFRREFGCDPHDTDSVHDAEVGSYINGRNLRRCRSERDIEAIEGTRRPVIVDGDLPPESWD